MHEHYSSSFFVLSATPNEIINVVNSFENKISAGIDNIPLSAMKCSIVCIAEPLCSIINCSFSSGVIPDETKIAKICPIFKDGIKNYFSNYRPISVLPSFSKIFEKLIYNRLLKYLNVKGILSKNQFGFRSGFSTYMALLDIHDKISKAIDDGNYSIGIFIDLSKAFDTVNHNILFKKLEHYGITGVPLEWFRNYLSDRKQCVEINNVLSDFKYVTCGVPQCLILGPLLFSIYMNGNHVM